MYRFNLNCEPKPLLTNHLKLSGKNPSGDCIDFTNLYMTYNGRPFFSVSGEFHFSRYVREKWEEQILKIKASGLDTIATYMFWNYHETTEGDFDFSGNKDIRYFVELCHKHKMWVILRVGPYSHGECRNGGLPDWLFGRPFEVRSNDPEYLEYVGRYFQQIGSQVQDLMFTKGGPIIAIQLENEYMAATSPWEITASHHLEWITSGTGGLEHIQNLQCLARKAGLCSAFYTCTGWGGAPYIDNEMLPLWGGYAYWPWLYWDNTSYEHPATESYLFHDAHDETVQDEFDKKYPFACCEIGGGMQVWYPYRFVAEPESVEAMSLVTVANGCNFLGYYMFHGGLNPILNNTFSNERLNPAISYDFQAPLGDNGQPKESYKRLKLLHYFYKDFGEQLCGMRTLVPENAAGLKPTDVDTLRYAARSNGRSAVLFINNYQDHAENKPIGNVQFCLTLQEEEIILPETSPLTIPKETSCAFLVQTELAGISLRYSTAQYITRLDSEDETVVFFFTHNGIPGEFCFNETYITAADSPGVTVFSPTLLTVKDGQTASFLLQNRQGKAIRFVCLSRTDSLNFHKLTINGQDYAVLTEANAYSDNEHLYLEAIGTEQFDLRTFPALHEGTLPDSVVFCGEGMGLHTYQVSVELPDIPLEIPSRYANRALLKFDAAVMNELSELYAYVNYTGDKGWAFINGTLIHDDLNNGTQWRFALKQHEQELKEHELYLYLSPVTENQAVVIEGTGTYAKVNVEDAAQAEFHSIRLVPEKTVCLNL